MAVTGAMAKVLERVMRPWNNFLKTKYPRAYEVQEAFMAGSKQTFIGGKEYGRVVYAQLRGAQLQDLTYKEMWSVYQYPRSAGKLLPILLIASLPFSTFVVFPLLYFWPRTVLTRHFWTRNQQKEFPKINIQKRLAEVPKLIHLFETNAKRLNDPNEQDFLRYSIEQVKDNNIVNSADLSEIGRIMTRSPFILETLPSEYTRRLARLNNVWPWGIESYSRHLGEMDRQLLVGKANDLSLDDLKDAAILRCLNPGDANPEALWEFLLFWAKHSAEVSAAGKN